METQSLACVCVRAFACVHLRAFYRAGLIKSQNAFARKNLKTQMHFGFRNFQDVLYIYIYIGSSI